MKTLVVGAFDAAPAEVGRFMAQEAIAARGKVDVAVWSDEVCFVKNRHMPLTSTAGRQARVAGFGHVASVTVLESPALPAAALQGVGAVILPEADATPGCLPPGQKVETLPAASGIALSQAGTIAPADPAAAEFDTWLHDLFVAPGVIDAYHQFIALFLSRLRHLGIDYFAHSGTSLGMVRNSGFIPWDDDFDIMVMEEYQNDVIAAIADLERFGIFHNTRNPNEHFYQFFIRRPDLPTSTSRYMPIDIFIGHFETLPNIGEVVHYKSPTFRKWFARNYIDPEDIYPLRPYDFGPLQVMGLNSYDRYHHRSGYSHVEAVVMRHQNFQTHKDRLPFFKAKGLHPIRDPRYVRFRMPHGPKPDILGPVAS